MKHKTSKIILKGKKRPQKLTKRKVKSVRSLIIKADLWFSRYIRLRDKGVCITCGKKDDIKKMDCGHYISRQHKSTRWDESNTACQCPSCNRFHEGVKDVFAIKLQKRYGNDILLTLQDKKNAVTKLTPEYLERIAEIYKKKVEELQSK
jgi:hypothetical protein